MQCVFPFYFLPLPSLHALCSLHDPCCYKLAILNMVMQNIFPSWMLVSISPNTLWFNKEGGFFYERLGHWHYQRLHMGREKGMLAVRASSLLCCLPHQAQVRILQLVLFLTLQGQAVPAATCWFALGCNPAGDTLREASSGTGLLTVFTSLSYPVWKQVSSECARLSPPLD